MTNTPSAPQSEPKHAAEDYVNDTADELAAIGYTAYVTANGGGIPWDDLGMITQDMWREAADAIARELHRRRKES